MSFVMALVNVGIGPLLLFAWLKGWLIGLVVAFPLSYVLPPLVSRMLIKLGMGPRGGAK